MSTTPDSALADPQQIIADLQRANAELQRHLEERTTERDDAQAREREALEQQTALAKVLGVINASPGNLAPVFEAMLDKAMTLCSASFGVLRTYDGTQFHMAATCGVPAGYAEFLAQNPQPQQSATIGGQLLGGAPLVHILDLKTEDSYVSGNTHRRALVDLGGHEPR